MALIEVELGGVFPFPNEKFGHVKASVKVSNIDTEGDVDAQLEDAVAVAERTWAKVDGMLAVDVQHEILQHQLAPDAVTKLQQQTATNTENIKRMAEHIKSIVPATAEAVSGKSQAKSK